MISAHGTDTVSCRFSCYGCQGKKWIECSKNWADVFHVLMLGLNISPIIMVSSPWKIHLISSVLKVQHALYGYSHSVLILISQNCPKTAKSSRRSSLKWVLGHTSPTRHSTSPPLPPGGTSGNLSIVGIQLKRGKPRCPRELCTFLHYGSDTHHTIHFISWTPSLRGRRPLTSNFATPLTEKETAHSNTQFHYSEEDKSTD